MKESFLYIQCNLVCYIAIKNMVLPMKRNTSLPMTLQNRFDQRSFPDRMCLRNPAVGGFGPVREETCLGTRVEQCRQNRAEQCRQRRVEQNRAEHRWTGLVGRSRVETGSRPNLAAVVVQHVFVAKCFRSY